MSRQNLILYRRTTALLTAILFLGQSTGWSDLSIQHLNSVHLTGQRNAAGHESLLFNLSSEIGQIKRVYEGEGEEFVVHIQDAHVNEEAQRNIARIVEHVRKTQGVRLVHVEGASGDLAHGVLSRFPGQRARELVSDYFLREGVLSGAEYLAVSREAELMLHGMEDRELYEENRKVFLEALRYKEKNLEILLKLRRAMDVAARHALNSALAESLRRKRAFENQEGALASYVKYLIEGAKRHGIQGIYPQMERFIKLEALERTLDGPGLESEAKLGLEYLKRQLRGESLESLKSKAAAYERGELSRHDYYVELGERLSGVSLAAGAYAGLRQYGEYAKESGMIGLELFDEIRLLEEGIKDRLITSVEERRLVGLFRLLEIEEKLFDFALTREDAEYFYAHRGDFTARHFRDVLTPVFKRYQVDRGVQTLALEDVERDLSRIESFYELALKRDEALIANALRKRSESGERVSVMIAGGFHTPGIERALRAKGISYAVVMPRLANTVDERASGERYERAMRVEPTRLAKLLKESYFPAHSGRANDPRYQLAAPLRIRPEEELAAIAVPETLAEFDIRRMVREHAALDFLVTAGTLMGSVWAAKAKEFEGLEGSLGRGAYAKVEESVSPYIRSELRPWVKYVYGILGGERHGQASAGYVRGPEYAREEYLEARWEKLSDTSRREVSAARPGARFEMNGLMLEIRVKNSKGLALEVTGPAREEGEEKLAHPFLALMQDRSLEDWLKQDLPNETDEAGKRLKLLAWGLLALGLYGQQMETEAKARGVYEGKLKSVLKAYGTYAWVASKSRTESLSEVAKQYLPRVIESLDQLSGIANAPLQASQYRTLYGLFFGPKGFESGSQRRMNPAMRGTLAKYLAERSLPHELLQKMPSLRVQSTVKEKIDEDAMAVGARGEKTAVSGKISVPESRMLDSQKQNLWLSLSASGMLVSMVSAGAVLGLVIFGALGWIAALPYAALSISAALIFHYAFEIERKSEVSQSGSQRHGSLRRRLRAFNQHAQGLLDVPPGTVSRDRFNQARKLYRLLDRGIARSEIRSASLETLEEIDKNFAKELEEAETLFQFVITHYVEGVLARFKEEGQKIRNKIRQGILATDEDVSKGHAAIVKSGLDELTEVDGMQVYGESKRALTMEAENQLKSLETDRTIFMLQKLYRERVDVIGKNIEAMDDEQSYSEFLEVMQGLKEGLATRTGTIAAGDGADEENRAYLTQVHHELSSGIEALEAAGQQKLGRLRDEEADKHKRQITSEISNLESLVTRNFSDIEQKINQMTRQNRYSDYEKDLADKDAVWDRESLRIENMPYFGAEGRRELDKVKESLKSKEDELRLGWQGKISHYQSEDQILEQYKDWSDRAAGIEKVTADELVGAYIAARGIEEAILTIEASGLSAEVTEVRRHLWETVGNLQRNFAAEFKSRIEQAWAGLQRKVADPAWIDKEAKIVPELESLITEADKAQLLASEGELNNLSELPIHSELQSVFAIVAEAGFESMRNQYEDIKSFFAILWNQAEGLDAAQRSLNEYIAGMAFDTEPEQGVIEFEKLESVMKYLQDEADSAEKVLKISSFKTSNQLHDLYHTFNEESEQTLSALRAKYDKKRSDFMKIAAILKRVEELSESSKVTPEIQLEVYALIGEINDMALKGIEHAKERTRVIRVKIDLKALLGEIEHGPAANMTIAEMLPVVDRYENQLQQLTGEIAEIRAEELSALLEAVKEALAERKGDLEQTKLRQEESRRSIALAEAKQEAAEGGLTVKQLEGRSLEDVRAMAAAAKRVQELGRLLQQTKIAFENYIGKMRIAPSTAIMQELMFEPFDKTAIYLQFGSKKETIENELAVMKVFNEPPLQALYQRFQEEESQKFKSLREMYGERIERIEKTLSLMKELQDITDKTKEEMSKEDWGHAQTIINQLKEDFALPGISQVGDPFRRHIAIIHLKWTWKKLSMLSQEPMEKAEDGIVEYENELKQIQAQMGLRMAQNDLKALVQENWREIERQKTLLQQKKQHQKTGKAWQLHPTLGLKVMEGEDAKQDFLDKSSAPVPLHIYGERDEGEDVFLYEMEDKGYGFLKNYLPQYAILFGDDIYYLSEPFQGTTLRTFFIVYVYHADRLTKKRKMFVNGYHKSLSHDVWKAISHKAYLSNGGIFYGKGLQEAGQTLPVEIQDILDEVVDRYLETHHKLREEVLDVIKVLGRGDFFHPVGDQLESQMAALYDQELIRVAEQVREEGPSTEKRESHHFKFEEGMQPDFKTVLRLTPERARFKSPLYPNIKNYVLGSVNGKVQYLFKVAREQKGKEEEVWVWIAAIQSTKRVLDRQGARLDGPWVLVPTGLLETGFQHKSQMPEGYAAEPPIRLKGYADNRAYLNQLEIIQNFKREVLGIKEPDAAESERLKEAKNKARDLNVPEDALQGSDLQLIEDLTKAAEKIQELRRLANEMEKAIIDYNHGLRYQLDITVAPEEFTALPQIAKFLEDRQKIEGELESMPGRRHDGIESLYSYFDHKLREVMDVLHQNYSRKMQMIKEISENVQELKKISEQPDVPLEDWERAGSLSYKIEQREFPGIEHAKSAKRFFMDKIHLKYQLHKMREPFRGPPEQWKDLVEKIESDVNILLKGMETPLSTGDLQGIVDHIWTARDLKLDEIKQLARKPEPGEQEEKESLKPQEPPQQQAAGLVDDPLKHLAPPEKKWIVALVAAIEGDEEEALHFLKVPEQDVDAFLSAEIIQSYVSYRREYLEAKNSGVSKDQMTRQIPFIRARMHLLAMLKAADAGSYAVYANVVLPELQKKEFVFENIAGLDEGSAAAIGAKRRISTYTGDQKRGAERPNQDSIYVEGRLGLVVAADGMGGHAAGHIASQLAVEGVRSVITEAALQAAVSKDLVIRLLEDAALKADDAIREYVVDNPQHADTATTLTVGLSWWDPGAGKFKLLGVNIGDSALWLKKADGAILKLSREDTLSYEMHALGGITEEEAETNQYSSVLQDHLGSSRASKEEPTFRDRKSFLKHQKIGFEEDIVLDRGDMVFAMTDGVHANLGKRRLQAFFKEIISVREGVYFLVERAREIAKLDKKDDPRAKNDDMSAAGLQIPERPFIEISEPPVEIPAAKDLEHESYGRTEPGSSRGKKKPAEENEDSSLNHSVTPAMHLMIVADGMGGHKNGRQASQAVVQILKDSITAEKVEALQVWMNESQLDAGHWGAVLLNEQVVIPALKAADEKIRQLGGTDKAAVAMGSTLAVVVLWLNPGNKQWYAVGVNIGDSYIVLQRAEPAEDEKRVQVLSWSDGKIDTLLRDGRITKDMVQKPPYSRERSHILDSVGKKDRTGEFPKDHQKIIQAVNPGDKLFLFSDGIEPLWDSKGPLMNVEIEDYLSQILREEATLPQAVDELIEGAMAVLKTRKEPYDDDKTVEARIVTAPPAKIPAAPVVEAKEEPLPSPEQIELAAEVRLVVAIAESLKKNESGQFRIDLGLAILRDISQSPDVTAEHARRYLEERKKYRKAAELGYGDQFDSDFYQVRSILFNSLSGDPDGEALMAFYEAATDRLATSHKLQMLVHLAQGDLTESKWELLKWDMEPSGIFATQGPRDFDEAIYLFNRTLSEKLDEIEKAIHLMTPDSFLDQFDDVLEQLEYEAVLTRQKELVKKFIETQNQNQRYVHDYRNISNRRDSLRELHQYRIYLIWVKMLSVVTMTAQNARSYLNDLQRMESFIPEVDKAFPSEKISRLFESTFNKTLQIVSQLPVPSSGSGKKEEQQGLKSYKHDPSQLLAIVAEKYVMKLDEMASTIQTNIGHELNLDRDLELLNSQFQDEVNTIKQHRDFKTTKVQTDYYKALGDVAQKLSDVKKLYEKHRQSIGQAMPEGVSDNEDEEVDLAAPRSVETLIYEVPQQEQTALKGGSGSGVMGLVAGFFGALFGSKKPASTERPQKKKQAGRKDKGAATDGQDENARSELRLIAERPVPRMAYKAPEELLEALAAKEAFVKELRLNQAVQKLTGELAGRSNLYPERNISGPGIFVIQWDHYISPSSLEGLVASLQPNQRVILSVTALKQIDRATAKKLEQLSQKTDGKLSVTYDSLAGAVRLAALQLKHDLKDARQFVFDRSVFKTAGLKATEIREYVVTALNAVSRLSDGSIVVLGSEKLPFIERPVIITLNDLVKAWRIQSEAQRRTASSA